jgi:hypothetical protein
VRCKSRISPIWTLPLERKCTRVLLVIWRFCLPRETGKDGGSVSLWRLERMSTVIRQSINFKATSHQSRFPPWKLVSEWRSYRNWSVTAALACFLYKLSTGVSGVGGLGRHGSFGVSAFGFRFRLVFPGVTSSLISSNGRRWICRMILVEGVQVARDAHCLSVHIEKVTMTRVSLS